MSKFFGAATNNGAVSGVKATQAEVEKWAEDTLKNTKASCVFIFEAVAQLEVAPRTIVKTDIRPTEENTRPDEKCEPCDPFPLTTAFAKGAVAFPKPNGHDDSPDHYVD